MPKTKMKVLVTGYGPFSFHNINPSAVIVSNLEKWDELDVELIIKIVNVDYLDAFECSKNAVDILGVDFSIHVGVGSKGVIKLEAKSFSGDYTGD